MPVRRSRSLTDLCHDPQSARPSPLSLVRITWLAVDRASSHSLCAPAREHAPVLTGSYDLGDPLTTNLHVGGLPTNVTEDAFGKMFAQFGPIGSIKVRYAVLA